MGGGEGSLPTCSPGLTGEAPPRQSWSLDKGKDRAAPARPLGQGQSGERLLSGQVPHLCVADTKHTVVTDIPGPCPLGDRCLPNKAKLPGTEKHCSRAPVRTGLGS